METQDFESIINRFEPIQETVEASTANYATLQITFNWRSIPDTIGYARFFSSFDGRFFSSLNEPSTIFCAEGVEINVINLVNAFDQI